MNEFIVALWGFVLGVLVMLIDGRSQLTVTSVGAALAVTPALMFALGADAGAIILGCGAMIWVLSTLAKSLYKNGRHRSGLATDSPITARPSMFGPRSVRAIGAAIALAGASWVSLNVRVAGEGIAVGAVFAIAFLLLVALMRSLVAENIEDLGGALVAGSFAASAALMLESGSNNLPEIAIPLFPALVISVVLSAYRVRHGQGVQT